MPNLPANLDIPDTTTDTRIALYGRIAPLLTALLAIVTPAAQRRPTDTIPGTIFDDARALLADIRRLTAREPGHIDLLVLHEPPSWAALQSRLAFAGNALKAFHDRYNPYDENVCQRFWRTRASVESMWQNIDLEDEAEDLSTVFEEGV